MTSGVGARAVTVGVVGLGAMGLPMATALAGAGPVLASAIAAAMRERIGRLLSSM